jgi:predicted Zn-dependent protease
MIAHRARYLLRGGRVVEAEKLLGRAVQQYPGNPALQFYLGVSRLKLGRAQGALSPLLTAASEEPGHAEPQYRLADAYRMLGNRVDAAAAMSRARRLRRRHR